MHLGAGRVGLGGEVEDLAPQVLVVVRRLHERERHGTAAPLRHGPHQLELLVRREPFATEALELADGARRDQLEHALAGAAHRLGDRDQLVDRRERPRHRGPVQRPVTDRARRAEAHRAGLDRFGDQRRHRVDVVGGGVLVGAAALTHHVVPHRAVGDLGADVERVAAARDVVHVVGERLPLTPLHALVQGGAGDVLDAFHQLDQCLLAARTDRREADAAVAHDDGGRTIAGRGIHHVVPADLAVVVGVHVDPARRDDRTVGVDHLAGGLVDGAADGHDHAVTYADVTGDRRGAGPVDDRSTLDHVIEHVVPLRSVQFPPVTVPSLAPPPRALITPGVRPQT